MGRYAGSREAREALVKGLSDSDPYVRRRAGRSLENFGGVGPGEDKVEGPMEEDGEGDIDGDGIPDADDEEPRVSEEEENDDVDYDSMTVPQLKDALKEKGLTVSGKKADLIARLKE